MTLQGLLIYCPIRRKNRGVWMSNVKNEYSTHRENLFDVFFNRHCNLAGRNKMDDK